MMASVAAAVFEVIGQHEIDAARQNAIFEQLADRLDAITVVGGEPPPAGETQPLIVVSGGFHPLPYQRRPAYAGVKRVTMRGEEVARIEWVEPPCVGACSDPQTHQDWDCLLIKGGRGSGKTRTGTEHAMSHLRKYGARARFVAAAPTIGDARDILAEGDSGIITLYREEFTIAGVSGTTALWERRGIGTAATSSSWGQKSPIGSTELNGREGGAW